MQDNTQEYDPISLEIMWSRLIAIANETAATLLRTSFSTIVRESNDYACVLMDAEGNSIAENTGSIPSFVGIMSKTTRALMEYFPPETLQPGDVLMTNDPWLATGHLPDVTLATPIFRNGRIVGWATNVAHSPDMGGAMWAPDARELYEEGLHIVPVKFMIAGQPNETLINMIRGNVRTPEHTVGDMYAQLAANAVCADRLLEFMEESGIDDLTSLSRAIQDRAEQTMRRAIEEIPDGVYTHRYETDGFDYPLMLNVTITVKGSDIYVDWAGTSPQIDRGLNSCLNYSVAYTEYPIKCALTPNTPKNEGSNRPIHVTAPEGSLLNPTYPAPVNSRQLTSHFLSAVVYGALAPAIPDKVLADSGSGPTLRTVYAGRNPEGQPFTAILFASGGMGAAPFKDGLPCTAFPTNSGAGSLEALESVSPIRFWKAEMLPDSGGPGKYRGGMSQEIVVEIATTEPVRVATHSDRRSHPAQGLFGGLPGSTTDIRLNDDGSLPAKGKSVLQPGDRLTIRYAGGGGYGPPEERDLEAVQRDLKNGLISEQAAREIYRIHDRRNG